MAQNCTVISCYRPQLDWPSIHTQFTFVFSICYLPRTHWITYGTRPAGADTWTPMEISGLLIRRYLLTGYYDNWVRARTWWDQVKVRAHTTRLTRRRYELEQDNEGHDTIFASQYTSKVLWWLKTTKTASMLNNMDADSNGEDQRTLLPSPEQVLGISTSYMRQSPILKADCRPSQWRPGHRNHSMVRAQRCVDFWHNWNCTCRSTEKN